MKKFTVLLFAIAVHHLQAQISIQPGTLKVGAGYTQDFPGLQGHTILGEYTFPVTEWLQGGIGAKHVDLNGYPRTNQVNEFTKATTIDFNLYWVPLNNEQNAFRIGLGYSFNFYNIKRAYPIVATDGKTMIWHANNLSGKTRGINLVGEYEYKIPNSAFSVGIRAALYKAYDRTYYIGPIAGFQF